MRYLALMICMLVSLILAGGLPADTLDVMFWNLENFFDYFDGGENPSDSEYSSFGKRHWSKKKFQAKCNSVAKTILWVADKEGRLPDVAGFAEVENAVVLRRLLQTTLLSKTDYRWVHFDSPDHRGIDVALLYRRSLFSVESARPVRVRGPDGEQLATRDVLTVVLETGEGERVAFLVNHHPSKFGGKSSEWKRRAAVEAMNGAVDSLRGAGVCSIVAMGDFNDTPEKPLYEEIPLCNLGLPLAKKGQGSIRYGGKWELIDLFFVDEDTAADAEMEVLKVPFLMTRDNTHSGDKPFRTWQGPKYIGGTSDHCPVVLHVYR